MKTTIKTLGIACIAIALSSSAVLTSCKKSDSTTPSTSDTISADDAADAITASTSATSNGMALEITSASTYNASAGVYTTSSSLPCGTAFDTSFTRSATGAAGSYNYIINWQYLLTCGGAGIPSSLAFSNTMHGSYDFPRISATDSASSAWTITGLEPTAANATINGTYIRNGSEQSKVRNQSSFTSTITYTLDNITVNKSTQHINGGSAAVSISGEGIKGNTFSYSGSIVFSSSDTATLTLNGNTYSIVLY